jgi:hypothetical protein
LFFRGKKIQSWYTPKAGAKVEPVRFWLFSTIFDKSFYPKADPKWFAFPPKQKS